MIAKIALKEKQHNGVYPIEILVHSSRSHSLARSLNDLTDNDRYDKNGEQMNANEKSVTKMKNSKRNVFISIFSKDFEFFTVCSKNSSTI